MNSNQTVPDTSQLNSDLSMPHGQLVQQALCDLSATDIIQWLAGSNGKLLVSTSFGPFSPVLLKLISEIAPSTTVVWVDTGYNTPATYQFVEKIQKLISVNLQIYHPARSVAHRESMGEHFNPDHEGFDGFKEEVKLEPFRRALKEHAPDYWITGIRSEESDFRKSRGMVSQGQFGTLKIAPLFHWNTADLEQFMAKHDLPIENNYFDPTKPEPTSECGLHCRL